MGKFFSNVQFPVFDGYKPKYWMDSVKLIFEEEHEKNEVIFLNLLKMF